jgi:adenylate cyclase class IV
MSKTEIEVRGPLTKEKFDQLEQFLLSNGTFQHKSKRLSVCYTMLRPEDKEVKSDLDIRARITDDEPELVIKVGKWRGSDIRKEVAVQVKRGEFTNLIAVCATLGYTEAIVSESFTSVYQYQEVEFSLVNKSDHSYFFEAEVLVESDANKKQVQQSIQNLCHQLGLSLFTDEQFFDYIKVLNKEVNVHYDWNRDGENFFKDKYGF